MHKHMLMLQKFAYVVTFLALKQFFGNISICLCIRKSTTSISVYKMVLLRWDCKRDWNKEDSLSLWHCICFMFKAKFTQESQLRCWLNASLSELSPSTGKSLRATQPSWSHLANLWQVGRCFLATSRCLGRTGGGALSTDHIGHPEK